MVKDRLHELEMFRNGGDSDRKASVKLMTISMDVFVHKVEDIRQDVERMEAEVEEVKRIHAIILNKPKNDDNMRQRLDDLMNNIKGLALKNKERLRSMAKSIHGESVDKMQEWFKAKI